jgi:hypothetical protein
VTPGPQALEQWTKFTAGGSIPVGTTSVLVSAWGNLLAGGGADGYTDNVDFQISTGLPALSIEVNRSTGVVTMSNLTGGPENISSYVIASPFEALKPTAWLSIANNYDNGSPGPNQVDPAHAWSVASAAVGETAESELTAVGANLAAGRTINLGALWTINPNEDLTFNYISGGETVQGLVTYVGGPSGASLAEGDLNVDGAINASDWVILRTNQLGNLSALGLAEAYRRGDLNGDRLNDHADFAEFKSLFDAANGAGSFAAMAAAVPEPTGCLVAFVAGSILLPASRRAATRSR